MLLYVWRNTPEAILVSVDSEKTPLKKYVGMP